MRCRNLVFGAGVLLTLGCVEHRATVLQVIPAPTAIAIGAEVKPPASLVERDGLPCEVPVSAWRQDDDGTLYRWDDVLRTPLPWWQRFPADLLSDALIPGTRIVSTAATPVWRQVAGDQDLAGLAARAQAAGYATVTETPP